MRFNISKKTLADRRSKHADLWDLIALSTGRHVHGQFVRRCIVAQGFQMVSHYPQHDGSFDVEFTKNFKRSTQ